MLDIVSPQAKIPVPSPSNRRTLKAILGILNKIDAGQYVGNDLPIFKAPSCNIRLPKSKTILMNIFMTLPALRRIIFLLALLTLFASSSIAQDVAQAVPHTPSLTETLIKMMPVILVSFFIFYFMVIKPQNQKVDAMKKMLETLNKGDQIITTGGIFAKIVQIEEGAATVEIYPQVKMKIQTEHIKQKVEDKKAEDKK